MSKYNNDGADWGDWGARILFAILAIAVVPLIMTVWWGVQHLFGSGTRYPYDQDRWQTAHWFVEGWNFFGGTPLLWIFFAILTIIVGIILGVDGSSGQFATGLLVGVVGFVACVGFAMPGIVSRDKVAGQFYQRGTTFFVKNPDDPPAAVTRLVQGGRKDFDGCAIKPVHDVPSCVKKGELPNQKGLWVGRNSSFDGAKTVLASSTANQQGADLMEASLTYLGGDRAATERWTGVIDGSGAYNPAQGVIEWYGQTKQIKKCLFGSKHLGTENYRMKRAFGGAKKNSMSHKILSTYTGYMYDDSDIWGYCNGVKPVFVVPMTKYVPFHHQVFKVPAGVLIIHGSESGEPVFDFRKDVKRGELDGPVVPASIVAKQRESLDWAAGRKYRKSSSGNNGGFGFDVASAETQAGNDSEYRLYNTIEKRWYYVSTLVPNNARSQTYTAMALTPTDEVHAGVLPSLNVYVSEEDPTTQANADRLHSEALTYISTAVPGFKANDGKLTELTPLGGDMWRLYGEVKGYTTQYIDMSATNRVPPNLVNLDGPGGNITGPALGIPQPTQSGQPPSTAKVCQKDINQMTKPEAAACIKALTDKLAKAS